MKKPILIFLVIFFVQTINAQTLKVTKELLCTKQGKDWSSWSTILCTNNPIKITLKNDVLSIYNFDKEVFSLGVMTDRFSGKYISTGKMFIACVYDATDKDKNTYSIAIYKCKKRITAVRIEKNNTQTAYLY